ncbi:hypothetical protein CAP35_04955 [Chitinophagaceae bacterium IBVUCB1]|nr:hypothetical protein CAP35_04955 [Chitinophagaceae bacterium IBVUCB1]
MQRRLFIRQSLLAIPALYAGNSLLFASCKKKDDLKPGDWRGKVIVIGAGIAGIYAAKQLMNLGIDVTVLEASGRTGGRIMGLEGFADFEIELGAEEVHGKKSEWYNIVSGTPGITFNSASSEDYFYIANVLKSETGWAGNNVLTQAKNFESTARNYSGTDKTVQQQATAQGINPDGFEIINAYLGNEYGTSNNVLSIKGITEEDQLWESGDDNYTLKTGSYTQVLKHHFADVISKVKLNHPVTQINYSGNTVQVTANGNSFETDRVIITVPLAVLQHNSIQFRPQLPEAKRNAISKIGMGAGMKIILKFNDRFWAADTGTIIGGPKSAMYWTPGFGKSTAALLTAFVMGEKAQYLSSLGDGATNVLLAELDQMYGNNAASKAFTNAHIMDWGKEPYIRGAYSYPIVGGGISQRKELATAIDNKLFFAGEATHTAGHSATVHGALETAIRAVNEITNA